MVGSMFAIIEKRWGNGVVVLHPMLIKTDPG